MIFERRFEPTSDSVVAARHWVVGCLGAAERCADDVALVVTELATNAVLHACTRYVVEVRLSDLMVSVAVADGSDVRPVHPSTAGPPGAPPPSLAGGRGLFIVDAISSRWGVDPLTSGGKVVWSEIGR